MDFSQLKMKIMAYQKVSPSILENYITKDDLTNQLENYVKEAPKDGSVYGRQNELWTQLNDSCIDGDINIYFGSNQVMTLDSITLPLLQNKIVLSNDENQYTVEYNMQQNGYFWICSTKELKSIKDTVLGVTADYIKQKDQVIDTSNNLYFYCYRITDELVQNIWSFILYL